MTQKLRDQLIGAWKLVSYEEKPVDGSPTVHPLGEDASGIIMYTPDGWMSAQLMRGGRQHFASGDWFKGTLDEYRAEASTYSRATELHMKTARFKSTSRASRIGGTTRQEHRGGERRRCREAVVLRRQPSRARARGTRARSSY